MVRAVVFDLDGVLLDSEQLWDHARREVVAEHHGRWRDQATADMQGMSSLEWSAYMRDRLAVPLSAERINHLVVEKVLARYEDHLPWMAGALDAVRRLGDRWPLALASSANRVVIDKVLSVAHLQSAFRVVVSSEEVRRGKPAPDVYLEAARQLGQFPRLCAAVEDSANGIRSALAAGLQVVAVPDRRHPPPPSVLDHAQVVVDDLDALTTDIVAGLGLSEEGLFEERLDEQEIQSFPASDPHSDWAGPPELIYGAS